MRFLLIDTSATEGSVALADTELAVAIVSSQMLPGRSASELLLSTIRRIMEELGWRLPELTAIAVVSGPGSFTGVRVGLSAAKGLSEGGGVPLIAVSRLALLAGLAGDAGDVCAVLDAGRGEFYLGEYAGRHCVREALVSREEVEAIACTRSIVASEESAAQALHCDALKLVRQPTSADILPFAEERALKNDFDDVATLDANYLRKTDAQIFAKPKSGMS